MLPSSFEPVFLKLTKAPNLAIKNNSLIRIVLKRKDY